MRLLLALAAAVPLFGQTTTPCTSYSLSAAGLVETSAATDTGKPQNIPSFTVYTQTGCPFVVTTAATWIHILPPSTGAGFAGSSTVSFTVDQNSGSQLRQDQITIYIGTQVTTGGVTLTLAVIQEAGICNYALSPASTNVSVTGGSGSLTVTTGCTWNVSPSASFVTVTIPSGTLTVSSGILGTATVTYKVAANPCAAPRTAQIAVQTGQMNAPVYAITQDGAVSNFTLSSTNLTIAPAALANQRLTVTTGAGCPWTYYTDSANWLHPAATGAVSGIGVLTYSVDANLGGQRAGHIYFQSGKDLQGNPIPVATLTIIQQAYQPPGPLLSSIVNDASFDIGSAAPVAISPGEIVALFGANLGPITGLANGGAFGTSLGAVQVRFGATAAPLIYVSATQINAVVPYGVAGSSNVAVTVQYGGVFSPGLTVPVQAATPGIFSHDNSGTGPGAILNNMDYSLNSAARPAAVGTVVDIYCTGGGVTLPASTDGALAILTPPFPALAALPVTVTIGGISAQVVYAGPAPGAINGLTQIDAVVPSGVKSGASIPVVVSIGGVSSQGNLSMAVQ